MLRCLQGSTIPELYGIGRHHLGQPFVATSLVRGTCLSSLSYIDEEVMKAAQLALSRVHRLGVLHGDISLENMMLVDVGEEGSTASRGSAGEPRPRVIIIDLGRSYVGASRERQAREMARLRWLLRA